jgi:ATP-dependent DNA helicase RecQ
VASIIQYAEATDACRSVLLGKYFGDTASETCGICDNCIAKRKKGTIDFNSFQSITTILQHAAREGAIDLKSLLHPYSEGEKEKIMEVVQYLLQEETIRINEKGHLIFNK